MKRHIVIGWFACLFGFSTFAHAQATATASRLGTLQVGAGISFTNPDYTVTTDKGPSFWATYDFSQHLGVEAMVHYTSVIAPTDLGENSYLIGPRYVFRHKRFEPYVKAMFGLGQISYQFDFTPHHTDGYGIYALGGGLDYHATRKINIRAIDFDYQKWPSFTPHSLSPYVITIGAAYVFH